VSAAPLHLISGFWFAWAFYWLVAARDVKTTLRRETRAARLLNAGPLLICVVLLFFPAVATTVAPVLGRHVLPADRFTGWAGVAMVLAGLAFAIWARRHLGRNWSGAVALKDGHALIRSGPYRLVRHPIYAGLLLALLGTAVAIGEWRGLLGLALALAGILRRMGAEDALMAETFGDAYLDYRSRTRALVPFLI